MHPKLGDEIRNLYQMGPSFTFAGKLLHQDNPAKKRENKDVNLALCIDSY
jgi:hypothetical protein